MSTKQHYILIDDSALDLFINEKMLKVNNLCEGVQKYSDAQQALDEIAATGPDTEIKIILLDLQMPGMNGFQFINQFRELPQDVKEKYCVFMLSSTVDVQDIKTAKEEPLIRDMLTKPLNPNALMKLLDTHGF